MGGVDGECVRIMRSAKVVPRSGFRLQAAANRRQRDFSAEHPVRLITWTPGLTSWCELDMVAVTIGCIVLAIFSFYQTSM
jgi:hypothetical protein